MMHRLKTSYSMNKLARGSLLGIEHLKAQKILRILKLARRMNPLNPAASARQADRTSCPRTFHLHPLFF